MKTMQDRADYPLQGIREPALTSRKNGAIILTSRSLKGQTCESQKNTCTENPSPCSESRNSNAGKVAQVHLRALGVGPGFLLRGGFLLSRRMEFLSCLHYLNNATRSHFHRLHQSSLKSTTTASRQSINWNSQERQEHSHASSTGVNFGNDSHTADFVVRKSASTKTRLSTTCTHRRRAGKIISGIWYLLVSNAIAPKRIGPSNNGRLTSSTVQNQSFISHKSFGFSRLANVRRGSLLIRHLTESHRLPCNAMF